MRFNKSVIEFVYCFCLCSHNMCAHILKSPPCPPILGGSKLKVPQGTLREADAMGDLGFPERQPNGGGLNEDLNWFRLVCTS
jgi:hypothetical protein